MNQKVTGSHWLVGLALMVGLSLDGCSSGGYTDMQAECVVVAGYDGVRFIADLDPGQGESMLWVENELSCQKGTGQWEPCDYYNDLEFTELQSIGQTVFRSAGCSL